MRNYFLYITLINLSIFSVSAYSEIVAKGAIPEKIMDQIYQKHPNAMDFSAEHEKHFGQDLYEIKFKEKKDEPEQIKFYRSNSQFYVDGVKIDTSANANMLPPACNDNLKSAFGEYTISEAILIVNPNGAGEEYDLTVNSKGVDWHVSIDKAGNIAKKERN